MTILTVIGFMFVYSMIFTAVLGGLDARLNRIKKETYLHTVEIVRDKRFNKVLALFWPFSLVALIGAAIGFGSYKFFSWNYKTWYSVFDTSNR